MARILVLYGTTNGHTANIAEFVARTLRIRGEKVDVIRAGTSDPSPTDYDGVIVAAPVRGGRYQATVTSWVRKHAAALGDKPSGFLSVCLGVLHPDHEVRREVAGTMGKWLQAAGWVPTFARPVAGALLYTKYNWFMRQIMKRMVAKGGGSTDTTRDHVYTNWHELRRLTEQFGRAVTTAGVPHLHDVA